jgi:uncharacterized membrane protein (UPF0127 family)
MKISYDNTLVLYSNNINVELQVHIPTNIHDQIIGYSNSITPPGDTEGMLFEFKENSILHFNMYNVLFPLDIIFFNDKREAIIAYEMRVYDMNNTNDNTVMLYSSIIEAKSALEVKSGFIRKNLMNSINVLKYNLQ